VGYRRFNFQEFEVANSVFLVVDFEALDPSNYPINVYIDRLCLNLLLGFFFNWYVFLFPNALLLSPLILLIR